jgi:cytochrome c oxidase assembly protein subunit 15
LFRNVLVIATILSLVQIILGTQVRQYVDEQVKLIGYEKSFWLENPELDFYIHRSLSIVVLLLNLWLFQRNRKLSLGYNKFKLVLVCIGLEILTGITMYYFDFPFTTQPLHLVIATILIGIQFYIILESSRRSPSKIKLTST